MNKLYFTNIDAKTILICDDQMHLASILGAVQNKTGVHLEIHSIEKENFVKEVKDYYDVKQIETK